MSVSTRTITLELTEKEIKLLRQACRRNSRYWRFDFEPRTAAWHKREYGWEIPKWGPKTWCKTTKEMITLSRKVGQRTR